MKPYEKMFGGSFPVKPKIFNSLEVSFFQISKRNNEKNISDSNSFAVQKDTTSNGEVQNIQLTEECETEQPSLQPKETTSDTSPSENVSSDDDKNDEPLLFDNAEILKPEDIENAGLILVSAEDLKRTKKGLLGKLLSKKGK